MAHAAGGRPGWGPGRGRGPIGGARPNSDRTAADGFMAHAAGGRRGWALGRDRVHMPAGDLADRTGECVLTERWLADGATGNTPRGFEWRRNYRCYRGQMASALDSL